MLGDNTNLALMAAVNALIWAEDGLEIKRVIESRRDLLLTDEADELLAQLVEQKIIQNLDKQAQIEGYRRLLARCRRLGIDAVFAEMVKERAMNKLFEALIKCETKRGLFYLVKEQPELLSDDWQSHLEEAVVSARQRGNSKVAEMIEERLTILEELRQMMSEAGWSVSQTVEAIEVGESVLPKRPLEQSLLQFTTIRNFIAARTYLQSHPELLSEEAEKLFAKFMTTIPEGSPEEQLNLLQLHRNLLVRGREIGVELAFAGLVPPEGELAHLIERLIFCDNPTEVLELAFDLPELLSDNIDTYLGQAIANLRHLQDEEWSNVADIFEEQHAILREVRRIVNNTGVEAEQVVEGLLDLFDMGLQEWGEVAISGKMEEWVMSLN